MPITGQGKPTTPQPPTSGRTSFADVFAVPEFRVVWVAQLLSLIGDQLAVVALTWLVYDRSGSSLFAAATFAIGFVPWLVGAPLLAGLADRFPRREVMVVCDLLRAGLVALMLLPVPLWVACLLLFATETVAAPFASARAAILPDILPGERYVVGTAIGNVTSQVGQLIGFALGGALVAALGARTALAVDAVSFLVSAVLLGHGLSRRPASAAEPLRVGSGQVLAGVRLIVRDPQLRVLTAIALLCVFYVVPEGLAAPYAAELGQGPLAVGTLLAAGPAGSVLGMLLVARLVGAQRGLPWLGHAAVLTVLPLPLLLVEQEIAWAVVVLAVSGVASSYQVLANAAFVSAVPAPMRGRAFGAVQGALNAGQGSSIVAAGALAHWWAPSSVVAASGMVGAVVAVWLALLWRRQPLAAGH
ncbi:MFS transporter [Spongisporangium articulatum]|uniref:MFS transporter n=1 Tax=Spongisporangium articulatum TaxID=3362603 RepID=A0ABW8AK86_9ACTN